MRSSLASRVTRAYVILAGALVVVTCLATMWFGLRRGADTFSTQLQIRRTQVQATADALATAGQPFTTIAQAIGSRQQRGFIVRVFDSNGRLAAGPAAPDARSPAASIGALFGPRRLEFPIPGGTVRLTRDPKRFGAELRAYALFNVPIAVGAILIAWWAGRRITSSATRPLATLTDALNALARGDFMATAIATLDRTEVALLVDAFNRASTTVAKAITERDRAQQELRHFIADAGHELRTPLTVIIGYLDALRGDIVANRDATAEILDAVDDESQRMRRIVEDLITLARFDHQDSLRREVVALRDVVSGVLCALPSHDRDRVRDAGGDAVVQIDSFAVRCAIRNVIDNGLRYTKGPIEVRIGRDGAFALVAVDDAGPGMTKEEVQAAFERFYRGGQKAETEGTGLGLAIVKTAIEAAGGSVALVSSPEDGTTVVLRIPLARAAEMRVDGPSAALVR